MVFYEIFYVFYVDVLVSVEVLHQKKLLILLTVSNSCSRKRS